MEPPVSFDASALRNEKVKVLSAIQPMKEEDVPHKTVRAQYKGYREEEGVKPNSRTPRMRQCGCKLTTGAGRECLSICVPAKI